MLLFMPIESLQQYIITGSGSMYVRVMIRRSEKSTWKFDEYHPAEDSFFIDAIQYECRLADIYKGISL
jgi:hypothetical protein